MGKVVRRERPVERPGDLCRYIGAVAAVGVGHPDHKRDFELVFADLGGERQVVRAAEEIAVVVDLFAVVGEVNSDGVAVGKTCQDRIDDLVVVAGSVVVVRDDLAFLLRQILAANIPGREIRLLLGVAVGIADVLSHQVEDDQFGGVVTGGEPVVVVEQFQVVGMAVLIVDREQERCAAGIEKRFQSEIVVIIVVSGGLVVQVTGGVSGFFEEGREKGAVFPGLSGAEACRRKEVLQPGRGQIRRGNDIPENEEFAPPKPLFEPGVGRQRITVKARMVLAERLSDNDDDAGRAERATLYFDRFERAEQLLCVFGGELMPKPEERCVKPFEGGEGCGLAHHLSRKIAGPGERILKVQPADIEGTAAGQQE